MVAFDAFVVVRVDVHVFRASIATPVVNAFGTMRDRPMALVSVEDADGITGYGEIWCNFPVVGAEHRARLMTSVVAPLVVGRRVVDLAAEHARLVSAVASQVLQTGEPGPFSACLAALDQALADLAARRTGLPLWKFLGGARNRVPVYASGLGPDGAGPLANGTWQRGFRAFKLKVGFGRDRDLANLTALRGSLPGDARLMVDANQAWSPDEAHAMASALRDFDLEWLEEPIAANQPQAAWQSLAKASAPLSLAAGENLCSAQLLDVAIDAGALRVLQPDVGKWGGPSQILPIARRAVAAGLRFCPHWLGGGVGLVASMHLLAAAGGDGLVEWDANPNPLREALPLPAVVDGAIKLSDEPGLGFVPDLAALKQYRVPA